MKKIIIAIAGCVVLSSTCNAESFHLKSDKNGNTYGPYEFKDGAKVLIGKASFTLVKPEPKPTALEKKMKEIIVPKLQFRQANITDVVNYLRQVSIDADKTGGPEGTKGVNFIVKGNPEKTPKITLNLQSVSLSDAVRFITQVANLTYTIEDKAVIIEPKK